jgi:hypothetical protein
MDGTILRGDFLHCYRLNDWPHECSSLNNAWGQIDYPLLRAYIQCISMNTKAPNGKSRPHYHFPSNFDAFIQGAPVAAPYTPPYIRFELGRSLWAPFTLGLRLGCRT